MAELATIARPYARAAFESAQQHAQSAAWEAFLTRAAAVVADPRVVPLIGNPRVAHEQLVGCIVEVAADAAAPGATAAAQRNFVTLLAQNRRLPLLPRIAERFAELRAAAERIAQVEVRSAQALTADQSAALRQSLERRLGLAVQLVPQTDASLLGGAIVRYGDFVVDGSLRGRIERLQAALSGV